MNFFPFHIGDYAAHTRNLTLLEDLAYRRLLDAYYLAERPLIGSATDVAREIGMREQVEEVAYILGKFFQESEGAWHNDRADKEIAKYQEKQFKASIAGKASAERRLNAAPTKAKEKSTDVQSSDNERSTNQEPRTKNQSPSLRSGDTAPAKPTRTPRQSKSEIPLADYLASCKAQGLKAVPDGHHVRAWAQDAGISDEMLQVAWLTFRDRHIPAEGDTKLPKKQKDWPATFANAVKDNWYRLWFIDGTEVKWTSQGQIQRQVYDKRLADHNTQNEGTT